MTTDANKTPRPIAEVLERVLNYLCHEKLSSYRRTSREDRRQDHVFLSLVPLDQRWHGHPRASEESLPEHRSTVQEGPCYPSECLARREIVDQEETPCKENPLQAGRLRQARCACLRCGDDETLFWIQNGRFPTLPPKISTCLKMLARWSFRMTSFRRPESIHPFCLDAPGRSQP